MFTGIIESLGKITEIVKEGENYHFTIESEISKELKIDQSVAHNGVCLTVVEKTNKNHIVTAIHETVQKTNMGFLKVGSPSSSRDWLRAAKRSFRINTSPRTSSHSGAPSGSRNGTFPIVRTFSVISSPEMPSPRVTANANSPR